MNALFPLRLITSAFDWSGRSGRAAFTSVLIAWIALAVVLWPIEQFSLGYLGFAFMFVVFMGHLRRRLRDVGFSGWWIWLPFIPAIGLIFIGFLAFREGRGYAESKIDEEYSLYGFLAVLFLGLLILSRILWTPYQIIAGSMKPTLLTGDYLAVQPIGSVPERADIIVFRHPVDGTDFIKRLIGLPGDRIQMKG
ncbi:signal peptidase I, partial [Roseovarius nitratireducens]|uniref:signal peptidase I n=1 Tax=Roseovarius nitratireducens TaxID=2044597 RepID=UPI000CE2891C